MKNYKKGWSRYNPDGEEFFYESEVQNIEELAELTKCCSTCVCREPNKNCPKFAKECGIKKAYINGVGFLVCDLWEAKQ